MEFPWVLSLPDFLQIIFPFSVSGIVVKGQVSHSEENKNHFYTLHELFVRFISFFFLIWKVDLSVVLQYFHKK